MTEMTSNRPYLIRAIYDWIADNDLTPHLLVDAKQEGVQVPTQFIQDDRIVLNIGPVAVRGLVLGDEEILFSARFGGSSMIVRVPPRSVLGIYAKENGRGMLFPEEPDNQGDPPSTTTDVAKLGPKKPVLKIVK